MACGALLAALAGGAAVLAHRVSVERDMERLAQLLPPAPAPAAPGATVAASDAAPPAAAAGPAAAPGGAAAAADARADAEVPPGDTSGASGGRLAGPDTASPPAPAMLPKPAKPAPPAHARPAAKGDRHANAQGAAVRKRFAERELRTSAKAGHAVQSARSPAARRRAQDLQIYYSQIFRRCPQPGEPGAVECRRHICNGAEREGPACKPFRSGPP
jgi:hypothetical protein